MLHGLEEKVEYRISQSGAYFRFFLTFGFFITYSAVLFMQRDIGTSYQVEAALLAKLLANLPETGKIGYFNEGRSSVGMVSSIDEFYHWFQESIIQNIFQDPICGDGTCDDPQEFPGFGRFGCEKDCGSYTKTTPLKVDLRPFILSSPAAWDISTIPYAQSIGTQFTCVSEVLNLLALLVPKCKY
jgi:hypothetical protein